jgi:hypothetical protein
MRAEDVVNILTEVRVAGNKVSTESASHSVKLTCQRSCTLAV